MKKLAILLLFLFIFKPDSAHALPLEISLTPALITIKADGTDVINPKIYIHNKTNHNISYGISLVPFQPSAQKNGEPVLQDSIGKDYSKLFQYITIHDENTNVTKIDLAPQQKKTINLVLDIPPSLKNQDYYFSVVFTSQESDKKDNSTTTSITQASAVNILLSMGTRSEPQGEIKEFSAPNFKDKGPVSFKIDVINNSNNFLEASGNVKIINMFGQIVGNFDLEPTNILANSGRIIDNSIWNEKFLLGFYTAKTEIALSPSGPILNAETKFFAFPIKYSVFIFIFLLFIIYIALQVKKRRTLN